MYEKQFSLKSFLKYQLNFLAAVPITAMQSTEFTLIFPYLPGRCKEQLVSVANTEVYITHWFQVFYKISTLLYCQHIVLISSFYPGCSQ